MKKIILISLIGILCVPFLVFAHPGNTDIYGCHYCWTNCVSWGLTYGQYHCHPEKQLSCPYVFYDLNLYSSYISAWQDDINYYEQKKQNCINTANSTNQGLYNECMDKLEAEISVLRAKLAVSRGSGYSSSRENFIENQYNEGKLFCESYETSPAASVSGCDFYDDYIWERELCINYSFYSDRYIKYLAELAELEKQSTKLPKLDTELIPTEDCRELSLDGITFYTKNSSTFYDSECIYLRDKSLEEQILREYKKNCRNETVASLRSTFLLIKEGEIKVSNYLDSIIDWCESEPKPKSISEPTPKSPAPIVQPKPIKIIVEEPEERATSTSTTTKEVVDDNLVDKKPEDNQSELIIQKVKNVIVNFFKKIFFFWKK